MKKLKDILKEIKHLQEDGHTDKPSAIRKLNVTIENAEAILKALDSFDGELMSWWMDKVTLANDYLSKAKDYIDNPVKEESINEALPKFSSLAKAFDYIQSKRGESMDLEQTMRSTLADIQDLQRDMEQEAEPEGGPIADKYAREMEYLKRQYNKTKAEFERVMDGVDEFDQKYL